MFSYIVLILIVLIMITVLTVITSIFSCYKIHRRTRKDYIWRNDKINNLFGCNRVIDMDYNCYKNEYFILFTNDDVKTAVVSNRTGIYI